VKESIFYNPSSDKMVGFVELGPFGPSSEIAATHALQFYARAVTCKFSRPITFFPTKNLQAQQLVSIFWETGESLVSCGFDVLGVIADG